MKFIKLSIWGALTVFASHGFATELNSDLEILMTGSKSFEVSLVNLKGEVKYSFKNAKNQSLYRNTLQSVSSVNKSFDLQLFPDGNYELEFNNGEKVCVLPIVIKNDEVDVLAKEAIFKYLPTLWQRDKRISVNWFAINDERLTINILDAEGEVLHKKTLEGKGNLGQMYDFSASPRGTYKFQLIGKGVTTTRKIEIK